MALFKRIVHPTDFSADSRPAMRLAVRMAGETQAELVLLYVLAPIAPFMGEVYVAPSTFTELTTRARKAALGRLERLASQARKAGVKTRVRLLEGIPGEEIVRTAGRRSGCVIVMGTHGRTGISRMMAGSVATSVVQHARCPVLTVRGR